MNNVVNITSHPNFGIMPAAARNQAIDSGALAAGIQGSFGVLSYKGKSWAVRYHSQTHPIWAYDTTGRPIGTVPALEVVILNVSPTLAKTYYEKGYVEGSTEAPDCWSPNAIVPDPSSPKLQSSTCQTCKWNRFGSKITDNGSQSKACQDHKRIAIVPSGDMKNERYGGPMLMRVPPASLTGLLDYADKLKATGWEWYALVTQISFDPQKAYPQVVFREVRPLTSDEIAYVHQLQGDPRVARIINEGIEFDPLTPEQLAERGLMPGSGHATAAPPSGAAAGPQPAPTHIPAPPPVSQPAAAHNPPAGWGAPTPQTQPGYPVGTQAPEQPPAGAPAQGGWGAPAQAPSAPAAAAAPPAAPPPPPPPSAEAPYQLSPDGKFRWRAGMASWEPVPTEAAQPPGPPPTTSAEASTKRTRKPRTPAVSPGTTASAAPPTQASTPPPAEAAPPPAGAWGAGGAAPAQPNGEAPPNDPGMAQFDDRLSKLL